MRKESLLELDLQMFAEDEVSEAGENDLDNADQGESNEDETEAEVEETGETEGDAEPHQQTAEENAQYAAMRRRAEAEAQKKIEPILNQLNQMNQQAAAMCAGTTHPVTGEPVTNIFEYWDALLAQREQLAKQELQDKGVDPELINRMVNSNPAVVQAQAVMQQMQMTQANAQIQREVEEIGKLDPSIKSMEDLRNAPYKDELVEFCQKHGTTLTEAFKVLNYGNQGEAARQKAINQMRGKSHLNSQSNGVSTGEEYVEVPAEIMARMKEDGKSEKQIRELFKRTVRNGLKLS